MDTKNKNSKGLNKPELPRPFERREGCVYGPTPPSMRGCEHRKPCVYGPPPPRSGCWKKFLIAISIAIGAAIAFFMYLGFFGKAGSQSAPTIYGPHIVPDTTEASTSESANGVDTVTELDKDLR